MSAATFPNQEPPEEKTDRELLVYIVGWLHAFNDWHGHVDESLETLEKRDEELRHQVGRGGMVTRVITVGATLLTPIAVLLIRAALAHFGLAV